MVLTVIPTRLVALVSLTLWVTLSQVCRARFIVHDVTAVQSTKGWSVNVDVIESSVPEEDQGNNDATETTTTNNLRRNPQLCVSALSVRNEDEYWESIVDLQRICQAAPKAGKATPTSPARFSMTLPMNETHPILSVRLLQDDVQEYRSYAPLPWNEYYLPIDMHNLPDGGTELIIEAMNNITQSKMTLESGQVISTSYVDASLYDNRFCYPRKYNFNAKRGIFPPVPFTTRMFMRNRQSEMRNYNLTCSGPRVYLQRVMIPTTKTQSGTLLSSAERLDVMTRSVVFFCNQRNMSHFQCGKFHQNIYRSIHLDAMILGSSVPLPRRVVLPSPMEPFTFLHIEKTAGSTVRSFLDESIKPFGIKGKIPCLTLHCLTFWLASDPPSALPPEKFDATTPTRAPTPLPTLTGRQKRGEDRTFTVIAGHFYWDVWLDLPQCRLELVRGKVAPSQCRPSCFTVIRHPIDRAISYYYQRCYTFPTCIGYHRPIGTLNSSEIHLFAHHYRQAYVSATVPAYNFTAEAIKAVPAKAAERPTSRSLMGRKPREEPPPKIPIPITKMPQIVDEGLSDASCLALLNAKKTTGRHLPTNNGKPWMTNDTFPRMVMVEEQDPLTEAQSKLAIDRLRQCVVGLQEHWSDTIEIMEHWFPWIDLSSNYNRHENIIVSHNETRLTVPDHIREALEEVNRCDIQVYEESVAIFKRQKEAIKTMMYH